MNFLDLKTFVLNNRFLSLSKGEKVDFDSFDYVELALKQEGNIPLLYHVSNKPFEFSCTIYQDILIGLSVSNNCYVKINEQLKMLREIRFEELLFFIDTIGLEWNYNILECSNKILSICVEKNVTFLFNFENRSEYYIERVSFFDMNLYDSMIV